MSKRDMGTESLRRVRFALRKVALRGDGKHCKRRGSSIADLSRRSSFRRLRPQGNSRRVQRAGFDGPPIPNWLRISSATLRQKSPVKQNSAVAASSRRAEKSQPFCESSIRLSFASQAHCKLYAPYICVNAVVEPVVAATASFQIGRKRTYASTA